MRARFLILVMSAGSLAIPGAAPAQFIPESVRSVPLWPDSEPPSPDLRDLENAVEADFVAVVVGYVAHLLAGSGEMCGVDPCRDRFASLRRVFGDALSIDADLHRRGPASVLESVRRPAGASDAPPDRGRVRGADPRDRR